MKKKTGRTEGLDSFSMDEEKQTGGGEKERAYPETLPYLSWSMGGKSVPFTECRRGGGRIQSLSFLSYGITLLLLTWGALMRGQRAECFNQTHGCCPKTVPRVHDRTAMGEGNGHAVPQYLSVSLFCSKGSRANDFFLMCLCIERDLEQEGSVAND